MVGWRVRVVFVHQDLLANSFADEKLAQKKPLKPPEKTSGNFRAREYHPSRLEDRKLVQELAKPPRIETKQTMWPGPSKYTVSDTYVTSKHLHRYSRGHLKYR